MENLFNWNQVTVFLESAGKSRDISLWHRESLQSAVYNSYFVIYCIFMFKFIGLLMIFSFRYFSVFSFCLDFYLSLVLLSVLSEVLLMSVWVFLECRLIHPSEPPLSIFFSYFLFYFDCCLLLLALVRPWSSSPVMHIHCTFLFLFDSIFVSLSLPLNLS